MSGHNKWSKVKNVKGKEDAKRAKIFTKMSRAIMVAAREGGADPDYNGSLASVIEKAKAENMPNENIERALKKATGELGNSEFTSMVYEGYAPEGVAVVLEVLTDNKNRTASDVRYIFDKNGGNLGTSGSVTFQFDHKGLLVTPRAGQDEEAVMMDALDAGAEDVKSEEEVFLITTEIKDFMAVHNALQEKGYTFSSAQIAYLPKNEVEVEDPEARLKIEKLLDALEDNDDVQDVYSNYAG